MLTQSNICIIITIVLYLAFMLYLGFRYADSSSQSVGDFYLGGVFNIYELLPAFVFALILMVVVSLLTPAPDQDMMDEFDKVRADTAAIK